MRAAVNVVLVWSALLAIQGVPLLASAADPEAPPGADRWVPSLAVTSGITIQRQAGTHAAYRFEESNPTVPTVLRQTRFGDDRVVSPYVGAAFELMTPALPLASSPRFFATGEVLPTFAPERLLAVDGDPSRIRGPEVGALLAEDETPQAYTIGPRFGDGARQIPFGEKDANGQGMRTSAQIDQLVYGAKLGMAFAFQLRGRQMRIKPSAGWIHYRVGVKGYMVDPTCYPSPSVCTNTYRDGTGSTVQSPGNLRESILQGSDNGVFDGVGPGVDLEMDTGRYGPLVTSLFAGVHAYYIPGDRDIFFGANRTYDDAIGPDADNALWRARVAPWLYRAGVGIRFQWLGSAE